MIHSSSGQRYFLGSVTRISDLAERPFDVEVLPRNDWAHGQYVVGRVTGMPSALYLVELPDGRLLSVLEGDLVIGAFGRREATLEGVGDWEDIDADESFHSLTSAGLFGKATSMSPLIPRIMTLAYMGHVTRGGRPLRMQDFVRPVETKKLRADVVLLVGTSMSAGKTTTGRMIIHELKKSGLRIVGAKLTGAGRFRDVLTFRDAGADAVIDFVDAGLPSTAVPPERFKPAMDYMLDRVAELDPDVLVAEAGASPLEPYNGDIAIDALQKHVKMVVLSASDPYSVVGVQTAFGLTPDLVTGPATNTTAGIALVEKLSGVPAVNLLDPTGLPALRQHLHEAFPRLLPGAAS